MTDYDKMEALRKKQGIAKIMANAGSALVMAAQANNTTLASIGSTSDSLADEFDLDTSKDFGELRKILQEQKRKKEARVSVDSFYDMKKGNLSRRGTIRE